MEKSASSMKWLLPVLLAVLAFALMLYFVKGCGSNSATPVVESDTTTGKVEVAPVQPAAAATATESLKVKLPDGSELDAHKGGIEDQLVAFLNDPNSKAGKDVWFDFDELNFETGSAKITAESQQQIKNIAAILKAFPKVKIKIGGYTDKTGDSAINKKLSQDRADATLDAIKSAGGNPSQLTGAEGYGSQFAKVDATASDEERKKDRRISVSVREK
ncbi:MAG: OmpA family protein [Bacteroidetes bacterium]|nr:MAG: OmpA family protein [Bacteroidota bacterium]